LKSQPEEMENFSLGCSGPAECMIVTNNIRLLEDLSIPLNRHLSLYLAGKPTGYKKLQ
jgi:hypothetical protein